MKTFLLTLSYDGTAYHGWQRQNGQVTVQEKVEDALCKLVGAPVSITASGRTDEGVHALGQTVSFACDTTIPCEKFAAALNTLLPPDIRAVACKNVPDGFCARKSAKRKTYVYRLYLSPHMLPHIDRYALRIDAPLDAQLCMRACKAVEGRHDFKQFYCMGSSAKTTERTVYACSFASFAAQGTMPPMYEITVCGEGFLYKMVRLIVGAILRLNGGKISWDDFVAALQGEDGSVPKVPAASKGLTLASVEYV